jgi:soluble lytic murein transglycosylase-like protein
MTAQRWGVGARSKRVLAPAASLIVVFLPILTSCQRRAAPPPTMASAQQVKGGAASRARAFLAVSLLGPAEERRRAALLAGLLACDAHAPAAALRAFLRASPEGGLARLAVRRLTEALEATENDLTLWRAAATLPWASDEERQLILVRGAEQLVQRGDTDEGCRLATAVGRVAGPRRAHLLGVEARCGTPRATTAARELAVEFPTMFGKLLPGVSLDALTRTFTPAEWTAHARAWLDAGYAQPALAAAMRAGTAGALVGAQAALRLRRSALALRLAERAGAGQAEAWVERAEAYRQMAWGNEVEKRVRPLEDMLRCARQAERMLPTGSPLHARAALQSAEALTETGHFSQAAVLLARNDVREQPRYDWVLRRFFFLQGSSGKIEDPGLGALATTGRCRRIAEYWTGVVESRHGDRRALERLADSGFPDLAAHWAAESLGRAGVPVELSPAAVEVPPPPPWATDLLAAGRVSDVVVAWRADLEAGRGGESEWLGVVHLADLPPLDAIPLLLRAEPRLATGPWSGLSLELLRRYLPLPWRDELERAAERAAVPPWVLAGLVRQESAWNPKAKSGAGAVGLTQLLPATAAELVRGSGLPASYAHRLTEPGVNLTVGALLLARWRAAIGGSWTAALACFNAGETRVREMSRQSGARDGPQFVESIEIPETWDYLHRVVLFAEGYRIAYWPQGRGYPWT